MHNPEISSPSRQLLEVDPSDVGQRLDRHLVGTLTDLSRTHIQAIDRQWRDPGKRAHQ